MDDVTHRPMNFFHGLRAAKYQKQNARPFAFGVARKILEHVIANQLLGRAMARIGFGDNRLGITLRQFRTRREDARSNEIKPSPRN